MRRDVGSIAAVTDPHPPSNPVPEPDDVEVDVRAFLPEGVALAGDDGPTADDLDARPEPEVPAWALDDEPVSDERMADDEPQAAAEPVIDQAPAPTEEAIDVTALEAAEVALADVEDALAAIDAGEMERSPLLVRLLAEG